VSNEKKAAKIRYLSTPAGKTSLIHEALDIWRNSPAFLPSKVVCLIEIYEREKETPTEGV